MILKTHRLILRRWTPADRPAFAAMNADPRVTEFLGGALDRAGSDAFADRIERHFEIHGFGLYAIERKEQPGFVGFVGLQHVNFEAHFTPAVEIGWRLDAAHWNHGYATEGARRVVEHAFTALGMDEIVSFTSSENKRSRRIMETLGMQREPEDDFPHPRVAPDHPLSKHMLYRLRANARR